MVRLHRKVRWNMLAKAAAVVALLAGIAVTTQVRRSANSDAPTAPTRQAATAREIQADNARIPRAPSRHSSTDANDTTSLPGSAATIEPTYTPGRGPDPNSIEAAAIDLAVKESAIPTYGEVGDPAAQCPRNDLAVSWERPTGSSTHGAFVEPLGPPPGPDTWQVNGIVRCTSSSYAYMGFSARWDEVASAWQVASIPASH
jgi:hypothetical protein